MGKVDVAWWKYVALIFVCMIGANLVIKYSLESQGIVLNIEPNSTIFITTWIYSFIAGLFALIVYAYAIKRK